MTLSRYENDHRLPDAGTLLSMAKAYGCDLVVLMTGAGSGRPVPVPVRGKVVDRTKFDLEMEGEPKEVLPFLSDRPGAYAVKVVGSAMQPTAYHGEYLILDTPDSQQFLEITARGQGVELVSGRSVGQLLGVFRKAKEA